MKPSTHVIVSAGGSVIVWFWVKSLGASVGFFLSGVLIDVDHHLDYLLHYKKFPAHLKDIVDYYNKHDTAKIYLLFHSYELFVVAWAATFVLPYNPIFIASVLGATVHIICDLLFNPLKPFGYFFIFRFQNGFQKAKIF